MRERKNRGSYQELRIVKMVPRFSATGGLDAVESFPSHSLLNAILDFCGHYELPADTKLDHETMREI